MKEGKHHYFFVIMVALYSGILFFSNSNILPHIALLLLLPISIFINRFQLNYKNEDYLVFLFVGLAYLNLSFSYHNVIEPRDFSSFGVGIILVTLFVARNLNSKIILGFIALGFLEGLWVLHETFSTLFSSYSLDQIKTKEFISRLYLNRSSGLSGHPVIPGMKFLICLLLLKSVRKELPEKVFFLLNIFFIVSLFFNFSRSALVSMGLFIFLSIIFRKINLKKGLAQGLLVLSIAMFIVFTVVFSDALEGVSSGRSHLIVIGLDSIAENIFLGNGSISWYSYFYSLEGDTTHNSFLHLILKHGLIGAIFLIYIIKKVNASNFIYVFTIFSYSFLNRGVFWNISIMDIFMFYFLEDTEEGKKALSSPSTMESGRND